MNFRGERRSRRLSVRAAFRTPAGNYLTSGVTAAFSSSLVRMRIPGGSVPDPPFVNELKLIDDKTPGVAKRVALQICPHP